MKIIKDHIAKALYPKGMVPRELVDLHSYFRSYGAIRFDFNKSEDGNIVAVSRDFRFGSIVTSGRDQQELEDNIKDAILTSFDLPSAYAKEANIKKEGTASEGAYALA